MSWFQERESETLRKASFVGLLVSSSIVSSECLNLVYSLLNCLAYGHFTFNVSLSDGLNGFAIVFNPSHLHLTETT